jgi:hypothetical protein
MPRKIKVIDLQDNENVIETEAVPMNYEEVVVKVDDKPSEPIDLIEPVVMKKPRAKSTRPKKSEVEPIVEQEIQPVVVVVKEEPEPVVVKEEPEPVVVKEEPEPVIQKEEAEPVVEQQEVEADVKPKKKGSYKTLELVECPKCGKKLTERTLKYSHASKCPKNEEVQSNMQVAVNPREAVEHIKVSKDIEPAVSAYAQRLKKIKEKQESFKNLATLAF